MTIVEQEKIMWYIKDGKGRIMKKFKKISLKKGLLFLLLIVCIGILTIYFLIAPERFVIIKRHGASTTVTYINPEKEIPRETNLKGNEFNVY